MKYFVPIYNNLKNCGPIFAEAHKKGLEFRLQNFFYDPKTQTYNEELAQRLADERDRSSNELISLGNFDKKKYSSHSRWARLLHYVLHFNNSLVMDRLVADDNKRQRNREHEISY